MKEENNLLFKEVLRQLKDLSEDNKEITKQITSSTLLLSQTIVDIENIKKRLSDIEKEKTEIKGFAKYTKMLYPAIAFLVGFFYKQK